jgi:hypothetical protein
LSNAVFESLCDQIEHLGGVKLLVLKWVVVKGHSFQSDLEVNHITIKDISQAFV